jgi:glucose-6-phosphate-specific signal transduction histidine kinase
MLFNEFLSQALIFTASNPILVVSLSLNVLLISIVIFKLVARRKDRTYREFISKGIRPSKREVAELRDQLVRNIQQEAARNLHDELTLAQTVGALNLEKRELIERAKASPEVVNGIGLTLIDIEKRYKKTAERLHSEAAKSALRLAVDKEIAEVTALTGGDRRSVPPFEMKGSFIPPIFRRKTTHIN